MNEPTRRAVYGPTDGGNYDFRWRGAFLEAYLLSDVGRKRKKNEDACVLHAPSGSELPGGRGMLFAVADGMGGATGGERASHMALEVLTESYFNGSRNGSIPASLQRAVEEANLAVYDDAEVHPQFAGMGTTVSAIIVHGEMVYVAQVGDSRLYQMREGRPMRQITRDHSLVDEQVRSGLITPEEARTHSLKNLITRAVGIKPSVEVDLFALDIKQGDLLLLCSDGLSNMVTDRTIARTLSQQDLEKATRNLVETALEEGGSDNVTVVAIRVTDPPPKVPQQSGAERVRLEQQGLLSRIRTIFHH